MPCALDAVLTFRDVLTGSVTQDAALGRRTRVERSRGAADQTGGEPLVQGAEDVARDVLDLGRETGPVAVAFQPESNQSITANDAIQEFLRLVRVILCQLPDLCNRPQRQQNPARAPVFRRHRPHNRRRHFSLRLHESPEFLFTSVCTGCRRLADSVGVVEHDHKKREGIRRFHIEITGIPVRMIDRGLHRGPDTTVERAPRRMHSRRVEQFVNLRAVRASKRPGKRQEIGELAPIP